MRFRGLAGLLAVSTILSSCNFGGPGGSSALDASQAVDPNTKPIQVTTTLDTTHAASAEIGPDGGTLSTTAADGTIFTLDIPAKALVETIEVQMIPLSSMDGLPWKSGPVAAVQLEPDGQTFYDYVTLTIQPAGDVPANQFIPVGTSGADHNLYVPLVDPKAKGIQLKLDHFSSAGATKGLLADTEPWRQRLGGDVEARLNSIIATELARSRQAVLMGQEDPLDPGFWDWAISTWKKYVLQPRLDAAGESCAAGRLAIQTVLGMERQLELMGRSDALGVNANDLLPKVSRVCIKEEYELCRDEHIVHRIIPVLLGMARQNELLGMHEAGQDSSGLAATMSQIEADGWDLARKCLHFELHFESTEKMKTADGSYSTAVEATVPIEMASTELPIKLTGTGALENTSFTFKPNNCSAQSIPGGGTFAVVSLTWDSAPPDASHPYGRVTAIHLTYDPGQSSEVAVVTCPPNPPIRTQFAFWSMGYGAIHANNGEVSGGGQGSGNSPLPDIGSMLGSMGINNLPSIPGMPSLPGAGGASQPGGSQSATGSGMTFLAKEWAVRGGDVFATKQWTMSVNLQTSGTEEGTFKLYHRPQ